MIMRWYMMFIFVLELLVFLVLLCVRILEAIFRTFIQPKRKSIQGQIAVVTGAGKGIGKEISLQLAAEGAHVACWDIKKDWAKDTVKSIVSQGGQATAWEVDVSDRNQVLATAEKVQKLTGDVTILINNAGIMPCRPLLSTSHQEIKRIMDINVLSQFWTLEAFLPKMKELKSGHVVCMSSIAGKGGAPNLVPYCASKYACTGLMEALEMEMRVYGSPEIQLTTVFPFIIDTGLVQKPLIRFTEITKVTSPKDAASCVVDGMLRNQTFVWIPGHFKHVISLVQSLPRKAAFDLHRFLGVTCDVHEPGGWRDAIAKGKEVIPDED